MYRLKCNELSIMHIQWPYICISMSVVVVLILVEYFMFPGNPGNWSVYSLVTEIDLTFKVSLPGMESSYVSSISILFG